MTKPQYELMIEEANKLNEENPMDLHKKMKIYGEVKMMYGDLYAKMTLDYSLCKAKRKEMVNHFKTFGAQINGAEAPRTVSEKESQAELAAASFYEEEAKYEARALHFRNRYESISEQINILKKKYEHLVNVAKGGV